MAHASSGNIFGTCVLASALHQDPRFYVKKNLSFKQSVGVFRGQSVHHSQRLR